MAPVIAFFVTFALVYVFYRYNPVFYTMEAYPKGATKLDVLDRPQEVDLVIATQRITKRKMRFYKTPSGGFWYDQNEDIVIGPTTNRLNQVTIAAGGSYGFEIKEDVNV